MSKKNNLTTRKNAHKYDLEREKEAKEKREKALKKKDQKLKTKKQVDKPKSKTALKFSRRGFRIKKNVTIKGIKVVDGSSKKKIRKLLAAEAAMREMEVEEAPTTAKGDGDAMVS